MAAWDPPLHFEACGGTRRGATQSAARDLCSHTSGCGLAQSTRLLVYLLKTTKRKTRVNDSEEPGRTSKTQVGLTEAGGGWGSGRWGGQGDRRAVSLLGPKKAERRSVKAGVVMRFRSELAGGGGLRAGQGTANFCAECYPGPLALPHRLQAGFCF